MTAVVRAVGGRLLLAVLLGAHHRAAPRRPVTVTPSARVAAAALAASVPVAAAGHALARDAGPPAAVASATGRLLLAGYVLPGAVLEELLWRAPLARRPSGPRITLSVAGFVALHVLRDGLRSAPLHAALTAAWTASVLLGRSVGWTTLSHATYNLVALCPANPAP